MPGEAACPSVVSEKVEGVPLYLIPRVIADQITKRGETVFCIRVERRFNHRYIVIVESRVEHEERGKQEVGDTLNRGRLGPEKKTGGAGRRAYFIFTPRPP